MAANQVKTHNLKGCAIIANLCLIMVRDWPNYRVTSLSVVRPFGQQDKTLSKSSEEF